MACAFLGAENFLYSLAVEIICLALSLGLVTHACHDSLWRELGEAGCGVSGGISRALTGPP